MSSTNMNNATRIDSSAVAMTGSSSSFNRIDLQSVDLEVTLPTVESGNIAIGLCLNSFSGYPAIARDVGGMDHANRNYIYLPGHGAWYQSNLFGLTGDWIQRLCIETDNFSGDECDSDTDADSDTDTDADSDADADADSDADTDTYWEDTTVPAELELYSITPDEMNLGEPIDVMLLGMGFDDGMDARIGGISITALSVVTGEQAEGRTPSSLPEGVHDVEVVLDDGDNAYLPSAFEVIGEVEPEEGCLGCSAGGTRGSLAWLGLGALGLALVVTRRRDS
jgi:uncharacterized protein (TIGR03382 family)